MGINNRNSGKVPEPPDSIENRSATREWMMAVSNAVNRSGIVTQQFNTLESLGLAFYSAEIDLTTLGATTLGTVPTGQRILSLGTYAMITAVNGTSGLTTATVKIECGTTVLRSATVVGGSTTVGNLYVLGGATANNTPLNDAGDIVLTVTTAATCPQLKMVIGVLGLLVSSSPDGFQGANLLHGTSAPSASDGEDGDFWIDTSVWEIYGPKTAGAWGTATSMIGPSPTWIVGTGAPSGGTGVDGDMYLDEASGEVYGPKAAGAWGAAVADITGPAGPTGPTGPIDGSGAAFEIAYFTDADTLASDTNFQWTTARLVLTATAENTFNRAVTGTANVLMLRNNSTTGTNGDSAVMRFAATDNAGAQTLLGNFTAIMTDATAGSVDSAWAISTLANSVNAARLRFNAGAGAVISVPLGVNLAALTTTPGRYLEVRDTTGAPQARLTYSAGSVYCDLQCRSDGDLDIITPTGTNLRFNGAVLGGGGGFSGSGTADFGSSFTHYTTFAITHASLASTSEVCFQAVATARPEEVALMQFSFSPITKGSGSWTVGVYTPTGAKGTYQIDFIGV